MSAPMFSPAADILKALGITETNVLRYSLHFSAEDVTVCRVDVAVCRDPQRKSEEQLKSYKVILEPLFTHARAAETWHDDDGPVLWWRPPVMEPPYAGSPSDDDWPGYHTHWTPIIIPTIFEEPPAVSDYSP